MSNQEIIDVVQADKNGREIEFRYGDEGSWHHRGSPIWDFITYDYRVKPEPLEFWVNVYNEFRDAFDTEDEANAERCCGVLKTIKVREVLA